jgi:nucleoside-diphosphate-sugar epimerase
MARILIVGAGDVGGRVAVLLAEQSHRVWALRRSMPEQRQPLAGVQTLVADVTRPETLTQLPENLDVVITALSPGESGEAAYRRVYVEGTRHLLQALEGQNVIRHFWVSSTSVYGEQNGGWIDDSTPVDASSPTTDALIAAEAVAKASSIPCTLVRFGGLYGPGRHWLLRWVSSGRAMQSQPPVWSNRIHVEDAAGFLAHLAMLALRGETLHDSYIGVDDAPSAQHEVLTWLAQQLGCAVPPEVTEISAQRGKRLRNTRLRASGYALRYPSFREGYLQVLLQVLAAREAH